MTDSFHQHIRSAIADPNLQAALDNNASKRLDARQQAYATLSEDVDVLRKRANAVRARTIADLDRYLGQFIERATANGMIIHRAADARQAVQMVLDIARKNGARLVAKSKTMVSEEIALNPALEADGIKVVETDLGEYIVQLRHEHPAHIITPAVHLRRAEVGQTFHEKLGIPLTDDVTQLTAAARRVLRQVFFDASLGISGVNFGVAETGTLCILTNEGNGRMVTTLPPVHVALMGMERLVPSMDDLALLLNLLPRASTGQKLTVYASLLNSPRHPDDPDGPVERHVIILDNGREALRHSTLVESLYCVRCGACLNACPVFREIGGHAYVNRTGEGSCYSGPIGSVISPALFGQSEFGQLARASTLCGACKEACPVDIDLPKLLLRVRAGGTSLEPKRARENIPSMLASGLRFYTWIATDPRRFYLAQRAAGLLGRVLAPFSGWLHLPAVTGWGYSKDLPRPAAQPFRASFKTLDPSGERAPTAAFPVAKDTHVESARTQLTAAGSQLVERFTTELQALGGSFTRCEPGELAVCIGDYLCQHGLQGVYAWDSDYLPPGLLEDLQDQGMRVFHAAGTDPGEPQVPDGSHLQVTHPTSGAPIPLDDRFVTNAGLTGALAGVAESGTLLVPGGPGRPLTASLLPEVHIVVLRAADLYARLAEVLNLEAIRQSAAVALISGPSRTADIEMTLTIGVHGPRLIQVFCI
jgi:L-lactate dehydrogenase complex protein LldF